MADDQEQEREREQEDREALIETPPLVVDTPSAGEVAANVQEALQQAQITQINSVADELKLQVELTQSLRTVRDELLAAKDELRDAADQHRERADELAERVEALQQQERSVPAAVADQRTRKRPRWL